jgi:hypothetical protein
VLQSIETAKRILGAEQDWRQEGRILYVFPAPTVAYPALVNYMSHAIDTQVFSERDFDLIKRYALAKAKADLGRVRSKYGEYPTAQGTTSLDGSALLEEAKDEIEALDEEIGQSGYPMGIIIGSVLPILFALTALC